VGSVDGKIAIVSGAGSGMGSAHVLTLVKQGARVVASDINRGQGPALIDDLGRDRVLFFKGNTTSAVNWACVVQQCTKRFGPSSVLVNNAGIFRSNRAENASEEDYRRVIDANQIGCYLGMQSVIEPMRRHGGGSVVNVCSTSGLIAFRGNSHPRHPRHPNGPFEE
jgi:3alpha(or 20beta)-hydroxysteroid dehydrogenase